VGYGLFPQDGLLVDLTQILPLWSIMAAQVVVVAFLGWWLVLRNPEPRVWAMRPPFQMKKNISPES
jgi:p-aminobenzoyl-glutamate transporter AbgT